MNAIESIAYFRPMNWCDELTLVGLLEHTPVRRPNTFYFGRVLLDICYFLYPTTRLDLLSADNAHHFYKVCGFRTIHYGMRKSYI